MTCPICARETDPKYRPFCSRRCADVDLGKWLTEGYFVPATTSDDEDDSSTSTPSADRPQ